MPAEWVRELVAGVPDPELPMLTIGDLGVLRDVRVRGAEPAGGPEPAGRAESASGAGERPRAVGPAAEQAGPEGGEDARGGPGVVVTLTPTYSACPALEVMRRDVRRRLAEAGFADVEIRTSLDPPWSTDWISPEGRRKLAAAGIAPPGRAPRRVDGPVPVTLTRRPPRVACPHCGSEDTVEMSAFGSTACKALRRCRACAEPFEHVKEI